MTPAAVLAENAARAAALAAQWDAYCPLTGAGSPLPRVAVRWDADTPLWLPESMLADPDIGDGLAWAVRTGRPLSDLLALNPAPVGPEAEDDPWTLFCRVRIRHDYEFWCASCVRIEDKDGGVVPFVLNPAQRFSLLARETQRLAGQPIRNIEHKGRQYGSTTDKGLYAGVWLPLVVEGAGNVYLISLQQGAAAKIVRRLTLTSTHYPAWAGSFTLGAVAGAPNSREIAESRSLVSIASVNNPQGPSGDTTRYAVISEAGKMANSQVQNADALLTNVMSTVPMRAGSCVLVESTSEAVGKWYRQEWEKAIRGESAFTPTFVSWTLDPGCLAPLDMDDPLAWIAGWDDYLVALFEAHGCTLEQVRWYEQKRREYPEPWMMMQEFPTTSAEGFQTGGRRRFSPAYVLTARKTVTAPYHTGRILGDAPSGPMALAALRFEPDPRGELSVWRKPDDTYMGFLKPAATHRYTDAFALAMDIGGVWEGADYTVITVLDRRPTAHGAPPEIVAEWRGHLDQDLAAWDAARLAQWYGGGRLAVEVNSLREDMGDPDDGLEPDHSQTVLDQIVGVYPNLYRRVVVDRQSNEPVEKIGWHTNKATKPRAVDLLNRALREAHEDGGGYVERADGACDELDSYLVLDNGTMAAAPGKKDDRVVTRAILMALHAEMPPCRVLALADEARSRQGVADMARRAAMV